MPRTFSTSDLSPDRQISWWQEVLSEIYYKLEVYSSHTDELWGRIVEYDLDELSITRFSADEQRVLRTSSRIANDDDDSFVLVMPYREHLYYSQAGRNGVLASGGYVLVQTREFYELSCPDGFENITIKMPARLLRQRLPFVEDHCACAFPNDAKMAAIVADFTRWIVAHRVDMSKELAAQMAGQLVDMVAALLESETRGADGACSNPSQLRLRKSIQDYTREHMLDPELSACGVARTFGISPSYLHRIFRPAGMSFWRWVMESRLQRAYEDLTHPTSAHTTIASIAYANGFTSQAHFSTLFRRQFGLSPREARELVRNPSSNGAMAHRFRPSGARRGAAKPRPPGTSDRPLGEFRESRK